MSISAFIQFEGYLLFPLVGGVGAERNYFGYISVCRYIALASVVFFPLFVSFSCHISFFFSSVRVSVFLCFCVCAYKCLCIYVCVHQFLLLLVNLSVRLTVCLSPYLSLPLSIRLLIYLPVYPLIFLSLPRSGNLSFRL